MKKLEILIVACLLIFAFSNTTRAAPLNPSFESGDLTGWIESVPPGGSAEAVTQHTGSKSTNYTAKDGNYFAKLKTDGPDNYTTISQLLSISAGEMLSGWAAFDARDDTYYDPSDNAWVKIYDNGDEVANPWFNDVDTVGVFGDGEWESWSWTASTAGTYTLTFGIANQGDPFLDSYALFDYVTGGTPVPEPGTIFLLLVGMLGLIGLKRKNFIQSKT